MASPANGGFDPGQKAYRFGVHDFAAARGGDRIKIVRLWGGAWS